MNFVLLEHKPDCCYTATLLGWPDCTAQGSTEEEALARLRQVLRERLSQAKIVRFEVEVPQAEHPVVRLAGVFKDDPFFDELQEEMAAYRRELAAQDDV